AVAQQQGEGLLVLVAVGQVLGDRRRRAALVLGLQRRLGLAQQAGGVGGLDLLDVLGTRVGLPLQELASAVDTVQCHLERAEDQTGRLVPGVADARDVAPGVGRVQGVYADRVAVDAAERLAGAGLVLRPALVAQQQFARRHRDGLADAVGQDAIGQRL